MVITWMLILTGALVFGITAHEYKHYYDLKDDTITEICVLNLPWGVDNIHLDHNAGYIQYIPDTASTSEFGATIIGYLVVICLMVISCYYLFWREDERNN